MEQETVIKIENLSKKFCRSIRRSMAYGTADITRSMLGIPYDQGKLRKGEFWSLEDINIDIKKGETFGLVGANGSGKSTLLRLINGIFPPDKGSVTVKGRIGALIAVGAGFHPHMTGRENIHLNGTILGMTKEEIDARMDDIIKFAEIGEFLDSPVSTYSSGMYVRLGFAIAIHSEPDIVLVDEILAVGDAKFQRKCLDKIREMREKGTTFILVSHNMQNIEAMCSRAILMDKGKQIMLGTPKEIIPVYELLLQTGTLLGVDTGQKELPEEENQELNLVFSYPDFGTDEVKVEHMRLLNEKGDKILQFNSNDSVVLELDIDSSIEADNAVLYSTINYIGDRKDMEKDLTAAGIQTRLVIKKGRSTLRLDLGRTGLTTGEYSVGLNIFDETYSNPYSQGYYGYFRVLKDVPTMLRVGKGTPYIWLDAKPIYKDEDVQ
ncbi:MAG: ATP-binding cassette domain-containing protein [Candidatus Doudnabacteria bacterium]|nr:ATP-binding cassette domain-containing protein [Candidatus Doudnabacteria bacterium]